MPRKCSVCEHSQIDEINKAILEGETFRNIAKQFSLNYQAVYRHKEHIPGAMTRAQEAEEVTQANNLLAQVEQLRAKAWELLSKAEQAGELKTALQGVREAKGCLELLAKLQGELQQEGTINITLAPEWIELRQVILQVLEPYPEAREQLAQALEGVEKDAGS